MKYAIFEIRADIICMGFGFHDRVSELQQVIRRAAMGDSGHDIIMFAAAGNEGANQVVAYPARDPNVFCVYSTDGFGNSSPFNPGLFDPSDNFSTLGEEVEI